MQIKNYWFTTTLFFCLVNQFNENFKSIFALLCNFMLSSIKFFILINYNFNIIYDFITLNFKLIFCFIK